jgi:hypothetical protein
MEGIEQGGREGARRRCQLLQVKKNRINHEQKKKKKKLKPKKRERVRVVVALVQQFVLLGCGPLNLPRHYVCICT